MPAHSFVESEATSTHMLPAAHGVETTAIRVRAILDEVHYGGENSSTHIRRIAHLVRTCGDDAAVVFVLSRWYRSVIHSGTFMSVALFALDLHPLPRVRYLVVFFLPPASCFYQPP